MCRDFSLFSSAPKFRNKKAIDSATVRLSYTILILLKDTYSFMFIAVVSHNSQKLETMSILWRMDRETVRHLYNGTSFSC